MNGFTKAQARVLRFIATHIEERGYAPTLREIATAFGWASATAPHDHLRALTRKGAIERERHKSRAMTLTDKAREFLSQPTAPAPEGEPCAESPTSICT